MSLDGDCNEVEVTPNLELLVTFGMTLKGVCHELHTLFHYKLIPNLELTKNLPSGKFLHVGTKISIIVTQYWT
jgi:hypothetical protein